MPRSSRDKGLRGEAEVRAIFERHGFTVRALEGAGDHLILDSPMLYDRRTLTRPPLHSEVKRHETARPWAWIEQAKREAPPGAVPVVSFRRNRSEWLALIPLDDLARLLA